MTLIPPVIHEGEVFVDGDGNYIGDFSAGEGISGPLGFTHANWINTEGMFIFQHYWENPSDHTNSSLAPTWFELPTQAAHVIDDVSGPPGKESQKACKLIMAGTQGYLGWVGAVASQRVGYPTPAEIGWNPDFDSQWVAEGWFRAVPDQAYDGLNIGGAETTYGYSCEGFDFGFAATMYEFGSSYMPGKIQLSQDWQHQYVVFDWRFSNSSGAGVPMFGTYDDRFIYEETRTFDYLGLPATQTRYAPRYEIHMKEVHLYPYNAPVVTPPAGSVGTVFSVSDKF